MMMKRILVLTAAIIFAIGTPAALAQPGPGMGMGHGEGPGGPDCMMHGKKEPGHGGCNVMNCAELKLTDEQKEKIRDLNFAHHQEMIDLKASMEKAQLNMRHEMHADSPDKAKVLAAAKAMNAVRGKMAEAKINHRFAVREMLTAEQLETWENCRGNCGRRGMGMRCGDGPGPGSRGMRNTGRR
jgi:Spy/CpxP family protein refolding chaperone